LAVVVLGAAGAIAATVIGSNDTDPSLQRAPRVAAVDSALAADLPVLARASRADDALPLALASAVDHFVPQYGAQPSLARHAGVRHGDDIYLVPAQDGVCFVQSDDGELFCSTEQDVHAGRALALDLCSPNLPSGQIEVAGIVPGGAVSVQARMDDGTTQAIDASEGVYSARFPVNASLPSTVEWDAADGHHSVPLQVPKDTSTTTCVHPRDVPPPSAFPKPPNAQTAPTVAP
jgi:hypothetical protein